MPNNRFVLDTSALFTFIEDEQGANRVEQVLKTDEILLPWVVLMEVLYISRQESGEEVALTRYAMLKQLDASILWNADEPILLTAAKIKSNHHLSFADSIIAASAIQHNATLLHKDPEFEPLQNILEMETLPYKK